MAISEIDYSKISIDDEIARLLARPATPKRRRWLVRLTLFPAQVMALAILPFWALIRGSVFTYEHYAAGTWTSVAVGVLLAAAIITVYGGAISKKLTGRLRLRFIGTRVVLPVVVAFASYSLIYLSSSNAKTERVRQYYSSVHPLMRVAASTIILFDHEIMITDLGRTPDDYARMGLTPRESSWHHVQDDGWVHAMDLRTIGRSQIRNDLTKLYFDVMGFRTLRHVGTADHLHVSLPLD